MPPKKRGQGFTRKKKKKQPADPSTSKKSEASTSRSTGKPPKTPASAALKKKEKQIVTAAPRRVSPRLLEIRTRKMNLDNGLIVPAEDQATEDVDVITEPDHRGNQDSNTRSIENNNKNNEDGILSDEEEDEETPAGFVSPKIVVEADVKGIDEDYEDHAALIYFWRTGGFKITKELAKEWIYMNVGDKETIGTIRYLRDLGNGFFFVYFDLAITRRRALATKLQPYGLQVTVFPWVSSSSLNDDYVPRVVALPGLPERWFPLLPTIGSHFGTYIGSIGVLDSDANLETVRKLSGWESAYNSTPAVGLDSPRIVVMMPRDMKVPASIQLKNKDGGSKQQEVEEEVDGKGFKGKARGKRAGGTGGTPRSAKKFKA